MRKNQQDLAAKNAGKLLVCKACRAFMPLLLACFMFAFAGNAFAQQPAAKKVTGTVLDSSGQPMPGVTVIIKGTTKAVITDDKGQYSITTTLPPNAVLVYSQMGLESQELPIPASGQMPNVSMKDDTSVILPEAMITGYQTIAKERATGSYAVVGSQVLEKRISFNATAALDGQVAGVTTFGDAIVIRGISTLSSSISTNPLLVIDGMPTERKINDVNMNDVESITVLKDAAATSIYGVRAANGVIVITTKKGTVGKTKVSVAADWQLTENPSLDQYHVAGAADYITWEQRTLEAKAQQDNRTVYSYMNSNRPGVGTNGGLYFSPLYNLRYSLEKGDISRTDYDQTLKSWEQYNFYQQYMDKMWRLPFRQSYNVSISNASDRQNTYLSFNYIGNNLQDKSANENTLKLYLKTDQKLTKWMTFNLAVDMQYATTSSGLATDAYTLSTMLGRIPAYQPLVGQNEERIQMPYTADQRLNPQIIDQLSKISAYDPYNFNVMDEVGRYGVNSNNLSVRTTAGLTFDIIKGLSFAPSFTYEVNRKYEETIWDDDSYSMRVLRNQFISSPSAGKFVKNIPDGGQYKQTTTASNNYIFRNQLNYKGNIGENHSINLAGGFEMKETLSPIGTKTQYYGYFPKSLNVATMDSYTLSQTGIASYLTNSTIKATTLDNTTSPLSYTKHHYVGIYAVGGYSYKNLYNAGASFRIDQADLFGTDPKYRYRPLWSVSGSWNISNESFMKEQRSWLNWLSLKASYGVTGNVDQTSSPYVLATVQTTSTYGDPVESTALTSTAPNPQLRWERVDNYNIGVEFRMFNNKLNGSIEPYYKYSTDLLIQTSVPYASGYTEATVNNGEMSNKGVDLTLSSNWYKKGDWSFTSRGVFNYNKNQIEKAYRIIPNASSLMGNIGGYYQVGYPRNGVYAYHYAGLSTGGNDYQNGAPIITKRDGTPFYTISPAGVLNYTNSSTVPASEAIYMGSKDPLYTASFTQEVQYKNWQLSAMLSYYGGNKMRKPNSSYLINEGPLRAGSQPLPDNINNTWTPTNTSATLPKTSLYYKSTVNLSSIQDYWLYADANVVDADMIRLRNITLSYTLPEKYCKAVWMSNLKLSAQVNNLWFWSAAGNDLDPEAARYQLSPINRYTPLQPSYLLRLELTF